MAMERSGSTSGQAGYPSPPAPEFERVWRGFAPEQVNEHLTRLAARLASVEASLRKTSNELVQARRERDEARAALEATAGRDPHREGSERVMALLQTFDKEVQQLHRDAEVQTELLLQEVRTESQRVLSQARDDAQRIVAQANEEGEAIRAAAQTEEREARMRAGHIMQEARQEFDRARTDLVDLRELTLERFRDLRERAMMALGQLEALIDKEEASDAVVVVNDEEDSPTDAPIADAPMPRPDL